MFPAHFTVGAGTSADAPPHRSRRGEVVNSPSAGYAPYAEVRVSDGLQENPVDYFAEPFLPDGAVDWPAARLWVGTVHQALAATEGTAWTDVHGAWLGRLAHDALRYQGVSLTAATPDDLADLLLTLQPAQRDTAPGPMETAVAALQVLFRWGVQEHGAVAAQAALGWLDDPTHAQACVAAMQPGGLTRKQRRSLLSATNGTPTSNARNAPRRKKKTKKRRRK